MGITETLDADEAMSAAAQRILDEVRGFFATVPDDAARSVMSKPGAIFAAMIFAEVPGVSDKLTITLGPSPSYVIVRAIDFITAEYNAHKGDTPPEWAKS